jgi:hypothetical protein
VLGLAVLAAVVDLAVSPAVVAVEEAVLVDLAAAVLAVADQAEAGNFSFLNNDLQL